MARLTPTASTSFDGSIGESSTDRADELAADPAHESPGGWPAGYCFDHHALGHDCWSCHDSGRVRATIDPESPAFGRSVVCPACTAAKPGGGPLAPEDAFARMNVPVAYRSYRLDQWQPATGRPRRAVEEWAAHWPPAKPTLFLYGPPGRGKTTLAIGAALAAYQLHGVFARFWSAVRLLDRYRATANFEVATESIQEVDAEMRRTPLLVLDDYGAQRETGMAAERMYWLFEQRYSDCLPMIVTSNTGMEFLPDRVKSRLTQGYFVHVDGEDHRPSRGTVVT
jgi:hypothetical protein